MLKIGHLVNPVRVSADSDLFLAQPITFQTMRRARDLANESGIAVTLCSAQYPEDRDLAQEFLATPDLTRSVLDCGTFKERRKLPLLEDLLRRLEAATDADYLIFTNVDIAVQPTFYVEVTRLIERGYRAFTINRRTVYSAPERLLNATDLEFLYSQAGDGHPGHDCFVFHRSLISTVNFLEICIGFPPVGTIMYLALKSQEPSFKQFTDLRLTFHLNDDRSWKSPERFLDYFLHNFRNGRLILENLRDRFGFSPPEQQTLDAIQRAERHPNELLAHFTK